MTDRSIANLALVLSAISLTLIGLVALIAVSFARNAPTKDEARHMVLRCQHAFTHEQCDFILAPQTLEDGSDPSQK